jgi:hypothetical protein
LLAASVLVDGPASAGEVDAQDFTTVAKGRYLSILSDCASCHTVPQKSQPFAGGRPIETPFGSIVAPNITPDLKTGIGSWTDDQFDNAVRRGIGRNGKRLYPAMPFNAYTKMSRGDVLAIRVYLNTVTAVYNPVVANTLPFPFNIRTSTPEQVSADGRSMTSRPISRPATTASPPPRARWRKPSTCRRRR